MYQVVDALSGRTGGRVKRFFSVLVGVVCLAAAYVSALVIMTLLAVASIIALSGQWPSSDESQSSSAPSLDSVLIVGGSVLLAFVLWRIGVRMLRADRHLVLFLRKFGFTGASAAMSSAIAHGVGRRWRLVTLDDHDVAPIGVGKKSRWTVRLLRLAFVAAAVYITVQAVQFLNSDLPGRMADQAEAQALAEGKNEWEALGAAFGGVFAGVILLFLGLTLLGIVLAVTATGGLMLTAVGHSARRAERAKAIVISRESRVERSCAKLRRRVRRVLAPRITITRVIDPLWHTAVLRLARMSDAVIVDISYPTDNLLWEVRSMLQESAWMLVIGQRDRLRAIADDPSPAAVELRQLLGDREVVGYDLDHPGTFSDGLRTSLEVIRARARTRRFA